MKSFALLSLGAIVALSASPIAASPTEIGAAGGAQYGSQMSANTYGMFPYGRFNGNFGPRVENSHLGPQKMVADKATGMTYVITFLPSGRSLFRAENGAEFIYDPRTKETILKRTAD